MQAAFVSMTRSCSLLLRRPGHAFSSVVQALPCDGVAPRQQPQLLASIAADASCLGRMTHAELCSSLGRLRADAYSNLAHLPWLQLSTSQVAFIQLVKSRQLQQLMSPVTGHPGFGILERDLQRRLPSFSNAELFRVFVNLQHLGVDRASPLLSSAFVEMLHRIRSDGSSARPPLSLLELRDLCLLLQDYGPAPTVIPHLCQHVRVTIALLPTSQPPAAGEPGTAALLSEVALLIRKFLPGDVVRGVKRAFIDVTSGSGGDRMPTAEHVMALMHMALKIAGNAERWRDPQVPSAAFSVAEQPGDYETSLGQLLSNCVPAIAARAGELTGSDLGTVAVCLRKWSLYYGKVRRAVENRALALLSMAATQEPNFGDLIGLVDVLILGSTQSPAFFYLSQTPAVRHRIAQLVMRQLPCADAVLLLRLAETLAQPALLQRLDPKLGIMLRSALLANWDRLSGVPSKFARLLKFASAADAVLPEDDSWTTEFVGRLLDLLDRTQYGVSPFFVSEIGCYVLPACTRQLQRRQQQGGTSADSAAAEALARLVTHLAPFVPQLQLPAAARLKRALNKALCMPGPKSPVVLESLRRLSGLLFCHSLGDLSQLSKQGGISLLCYVARNLLTKDYPWDLRWQQEQLASQLMSQCRQLIGQLSDLALVHLLLLYHHMCYHDAPAFALCERRLYEASEAAAAAAGNRDPPSENPAWQQQVQAALRLFARVGHTPSNVAKFMDLCSQVVVSQSDKMRPSELLVFACNLASIGCFPRELLLSMFTIQFLSQLEDELLQMSADAHSTYSRLLMFLNRAIVLEASPDLGIPWFHSSYAGHDYSSQDDRVNVGGTFFGDVDKTLASLLGPGYYARDTTTSYFHKLDFELAVVNGRPVKADSLGSLPEGARRIGIMLLSDRMCCMHSSKPNGAVEWNLRQLGLIGYDIIKIHRNEWILSLSTAHRKEDCLHKRIFVSEQA